MNKILKVGIVGMGNMGRGHGQNILKMDCAILSALCSAPCDDAKRFADEHNLTCAIYEDAFEMIEQEALDVLYICLPPFAHKGQLEAAAKKGIHIFIEKPIAMDVERGQSMLEAVKSNKVHTQVGYQMRFGGAVAQFKELLLDGTAGKPTLFTAHYECNSLHSLWWMDVTKCGGQVFEQVIHLYDMGLYLMGEAREVSGYVSNQCHQDVLGYTVEDTSVANIRFVSNALGSITGSNCAVKNQWNGRFRIVCENMIADFDDFNHARFIDTRGDEPVVQTVACDVDATWAEDWYFIETVQGRRTPFATLAEGFQGLKMVSAVVESSKNNGTAINIRKQN